MTKKKVPEKDRSALNPEFYRSISEILQIARSRAYRTVNFAMVEAYWHIGRRIIEEEQQGSERAEYGKRLLKELSARLTEDFGKGFTETNLKYFRQFYFAFPTGIRHAVRDESSKGRETELLPDKKDAIRHALRGELTWTHYRLLLRVKSAKARTWYMNEAADQNWSSRALERQINSLYYERLLASRERGPVIEEMRQETAPLAAQPADFIRDPYVLEFLNLPDKESFRETDLEQAIIGKLQSFMLELGKGFAFVARQQRISTETKDFFIDLVFYNYILKCFVLIDLKTGELTHQDIGQMDMYVRLYEDRVRSEGDNPTIGIVLCTEKDATIVKYSVLKENKRLFASKYQLYLPTEQELIEEIEREKALIVRKQNAG